MEVHFTVNLLDLRRAFRRLLARLPDESEAGGGFVLFNADGSNLDIVDRGTSEAWGALSRSRAKQEFRLPSFVASPELYSSIAAGSSRFRFRLGP